jgi:hypothetical protein
MSGSIGRYHCWDDTKGYPTRPVGSEPAQGSEDGSHEHHVHIHIGDEALSRSGVPRASRRDNAGDPGEEMPAARRNGNGPNGAQPRMLARMLQDGRDGSWAATDAEGNPCEVRNGDDGALEIWRHQPSGEEQNGDADPNIVGTYPSEVTGEAGLRAGPAHDSYDRRALDRLQRRGWNGTDLVDSFASTRAYAQQMSEMFRPKR